MRTALRRDLTAALKARDRVAIAALRSALAAISNAEAPPAGQPSHHIADNEHIAGSATGVGATEVARRQLSEADLHVIVETEMHERSVAAEGYELIGRDDLAEPLRSEAAVLNRYVCPGR